MAFGTGTHPTTRGCLELLEEVTASLPPHANATALDVGTGSGILAIALAKMGVESVLAIDIDPIALKTARLNVRRNEVRHRVKLSSLPLTKIKGSFAIVVANLTSESLISLAPPLEKKVSPGGDLVLSGILRPKAGEVLGHFRGPFALVRQINHREWTSFLLKKKS